MFGRATENTERAEQIARVRALVAHELPGSDPEQIAVGLTPERDSGARARWIAQRRPATAFIVTAIAAAGIAVAVTLSSAPGVQPVAAPQVAATGSPMMSDGPASTEVGKAKSSSASIVVSVVGLVASPGLVNLPEGSRVADAIAACGGALPGTDLNTINLARVLSDGEQIPVGVPSMPPNVGTAPDISAAGSGSTAKVNINLATADDLDSLPGIGPVLAKRIVDFRTKNGKFKTVNDIGQVSGIGPAVLINIKDLVTV